jgi:1-acyl-sn-glycerol-3-phosphate acyltransferase
MFYWIIKGIAWPLKTLYFRVRAEGTGHVPRRGPAILIANHVSYLDAGVLGSVVPRKIHFIVLSRMYAMWRLRWFYAGMETIPVQPGRPDRAAIRRALQVLRRGGVVGIFPEGSRSPDGSLQPAQPGAAMIAARSGAPVVPAAIRGAREAFGRGRAWPRPQRIRVRFGPPFRIEGGSKETRDSLQRHSQRMMSAIAALMAEDPTSGAREGRR